MDNSILGALFRTDLTVEIRTERSGAPQRFALPEFHVIDLCFCAGHYRIRQGPRVVYPLPGPI